MKPRITQAQLEAACAAVFDSTDSKRRWLEQGNYAVKPTWDEQSEQRRAAMRRSMASGFRAAGFVVERTPSQSMDPASTKGTK